MNEREIFIQALPIADPGEQAAFLDRACGPDQPLRQQLADLLSAHARAQSFLEAPPSAIAREPGPTTAGAAAERPGTQIGPYKLLQEIGQGGMGVVYMAEQHEPVKRRVALKIIKPGMDTRQVIARFEAERQALSLMDHPNIAKVLDAGTTDSGRPYFVMELVKGQPITQYCDEHHLTPRQRLELLLPVCQAIQHAHQKGIIHRDIKPTNILVAEYDNRPVPKVIDFGVAKAISRSLTEKTMFTGLGQIVGTLEYMSPEQAKVNQLDIDTRSDIYSLGVLLYELLTGSTPFDKNRLRSAAWDEMLRIIREEEPEKPSTRLSESSRHAPRADCTNGTRSVPTTLASIAAVRGTEPARLTKVVRGELDWIVMKALEKDRNRRYETANGFAMDVQHYLADEAVLACPPSMGYRLRKFARRNRSGLAVAGLVLFFLVLLGSVSGWAWRDRVAREREAQLEQTARATERANHLERAVERAELLQREGKRGEALAALERARLLAGEAEPAPPLANRIDSLQQLLDAEGRDEVFVAQFEAIRLEVQTEVDVEKSSFRSDKGPPKIREALEHYGIAMGLTPPETAVAHIQKRPAAIQSIVVAALDECLWYAPRDESGTREWLIDVLQRADSDPWRDKARRASKEPATLEALAKDINVRQQPPSFLLLVVKTLPIESPSRLDLDRSVRFAYPGDFWANHQLGWDLDRAGKHAEAVRYYTAALALRPDNPGVLVNRANALKKAGELDAAVADFQRAIAVSPRYAAAHDDLGLALSDQKKLPEAIAAYRKAIELNPKYAAAHIDLGNALWRQKKLDEAIAHYRKAIELDPKNAGIYSNLGNALFDQKKWDEAADAYRKAVEENPTNTWAQTRLGDALRLKGDADVAIAAYRKVIELNPKNAWAHNCLADVLWRQKKLDEAIAHYHKAIELDPKNAGIYSNLGNALFDQKKWDEAAAAFSKAIELDPKYVPAHYALGIGLLYKGNLDGAIAALRKVVQLQPENVEGHRQLCAILRRRGQWQDVIAAYEHAIQCKPDIVDFHRELAIILTTCPEVNLRDGHRAVMAAKRHLELLKPDNYFGWSLLGWAQYRAGDWKASIEALEKSLALQKNPSRPAEDSIFLSMAHWQLGNKVAAHSWYDRAVQWMDKNQPKNEELRRFRAEAAELLELDEKK